MSRPSKPISKNSNSKFITRNNKQDIFSKIAKSSKVKDESDKEKKTMDGNKPLSDNQS